MGMSTMYASRPKSVPKAEIILYPVVYTQILSLSKTIWFEEFQYPYQNMCGSRKFSQRGSNFDNVFFS